MIFSASSSSTIAMAFTAAAAPEPALLHCMQSTRAKRACQPCCLTSTRKRSKRDARAVIERELFAASLLLLLDAIGVATLPPSPPPPSPALVSIRVTSNICEAGRKRQVGSKAFKQPPWRRAGTWIGRIAAAPTALRMPLPAEELLGPAAAADATVGPPAEVLLPAP